MRSDKMKTGVQRIAHRSLFKALGLTEEELNRPIIGIVNSQNEVIPGHIHLDTIAEAVKAGIRIAGGTPIEFPAIGPRTPISLCTINPTSSAISKYSGVGTKL